MMSVTHGQNIKLGRDEKSNFGVFIFRLTHFRYSAYTLYSTSLPLFKTFLAFPQKNYLTKKTVLIIHGTMNMHHITKSLFVGAAIAGIGMASGRAELQIKESSKKCARVIFGYRLNRCYDEFRHCLPSELNLYIQHMIWDLTDYQSDAVYRAWEEEDAQTIFDSLFGKGGYLSHFKDAKDYLNASDDDRRKTLKEFLEAEFSFKSIEFVRGDFKGIKGKTLNLMCFLKKVVSRLDTNICLDAIHYYNYFDDNVPYALINIGVIKEDKQAGCYLPEWSFIFNDRFIKDVASLITEDVKQQINNK